MARRERHREEMPDYMVAARLEKIADKYDFPLLVCNDCGKSFDCSDVLKGIAEGLRKGLVERKGK